MKRAEHLQVELQIAPMIDVCFLLLFFYILTSKPAKPESHIGLTLPGTVEQEQALDLPDEQRLTIQPNGQVLLNEQPFDSPASRELPTLLQTLSRLRETTAANRSAALLVIDAADSASHQRIVDVLNACSSAGITHVTLATSDEDAP
jgi:biopolymer transport protein ExbD